MSDKKNYEVPTIDVVRVNPRDIKCNMSSDTDVNAPGSEVYGPYE